MPCPPAKHRMVRDFGEHEYRCLYCGRGQLAAVVATDELRALMEQHRSMQLDEALAVLAARQQAQEGAA